MNAKTKVRRRELWHMVKRLRCFSWTAIPMGAGRVNYQIGQERLIKSAFSQKETQSENANLVCDKSTTLRLLSDTLSALQEQLKEKDKQIERLQTELEQAQRNVTLAQQLHAVTEQKMLEQKEEVPEKKNWFWGRRK